MFKQLKAAKLFHAELHLECSNVFLYFQKLFGDKKFQDLFNLPEVDDQMRSLVVRNYIRSNFTHAMNIYVNDLVSDELPQVQSMFSKYSDENRTAFFQLCVVILLLVIDGYEATTEAKPVEGKYVVFPTVV